MTKNYIIEGLRDEYQPYVSAIYDQLHIKDIDDFQLSVIQACNRFEAKFKDKVERHAISSHFGSINDNFGYQQPPEEKKPPSPASVKEPILQ